MSASTAAAAAPALPSPLLTAPGAVPAEGADEGTAAHYGDPLREQRLLTDDVGVVDRSTRGVLHVAGPDRLSWLHSLTSQHLADLPAGRSTEALVLSPHGHVEHHLLLADDGERTWVDVEPGTAPALLAFLDRMRFLLRVEPSDVSTRWAVLSLAGPRTSTVLSVLGAVPASPYDVVSVGDLLVRRMPPEPVDAADLVVPREQLSQVVDRLQGAGAGLAGAEAYAALRVQARRPRLGFETNHRTIPHEVGWLASAVHLNKGCYRGQETVARVHNLGRPPRRLVLLHLDGSGSDLPASADPVTLDGRPVGFVTTSARHHELGPVALALVKRAIADDAALLAGGVPASIDTD